MAAPSVVAIGTPGTSTITTIDVPCPGAPVADVHLIWIDILMLGDAPTPPSGFSLHHTMPEAGQITGYRYSKKATASEPSTYQFSTTAIGEGWLGFPYLILNADLSNHPTSVLDGTPVADSNALSTIDAPSITLAFNSLLMALLGTRVTGADIASTLGVMSALVATTAFGNRSGRSFQQTPGPGATGTRNFTISGGTSTNTVGMLAIAPAPPTTYEVTPDYKFGQIPPNLRAG